jgi:sulfoxide reductase heme-binding subunit YedZ
MVTDVRFVKLVVFVNSVVPLALLGWDAYHHRLGANPLEFVTHITGTLTLVYLLVTLAVTPLRRLSNQPWMVKLRRMVGLFAFFYGMLHLVTYLWFDRFFKVGSILSDVAKRPFIAIGMAGFLMMVPLAVTSTNRMVKRIGGKRWNRLHKLVYVAGVAGVVHYWMLVKADTRIPLMFGVVLAVLLAYRLGAYGYKALNRKTAGGVTTT